MNDEIGELATAMSFEGFAAYTSVGLNFTGAGEPERLSCSTKSNRPTRSHSPAYQPCS